MKFNIRNINWLLTLLVLAFSSQKVQAREITAESGANGTGTVVTPNGDQLNISGGELAGNNLFHSFDQFVLNANQVANFLSNPQIQNILGRVVGGDVSVIDGLIRVSGGNSNLFLMNPAGIVFGANARLDVPASFTTTTATGIGFGDDFFNAVGSNDYTKLVGNPDNFVFATSELGSIFNAGDLAVKYEQNITLLGGSVISTGSISAPGGQITIAAVPGENLVRISQQGQVLSLELETFGGESSDLTNPLSFHPVSLAQMLTDAEVGNATGARVNDDGSISLTGSGISFNAKTGTVVASGILDVSNTKPGESGGTVGVLGEKVALVGAEIEASGEGGGGTVLVGGDYQGQGEVVNAAETYVSGDSEIAADGLVEGDGGRVIVWADQATQFYGNINARGGSEGGNGGFVEVSGKKNLIFDGLVDVGASLGENGQLLLDPNRVVIGLSGNDNAQLDDGQILATDQPGDVFFISATRVDQALSNGDVMIAATDEITIINGNILPLGNKPSDLTLESAIINVEASRLEVLGNLSLQAQEEIILEESQLRSPENIELLAQNTIQIIDGAEPSIVFAGGNISIQGNQEIDIQALNNPQSVLRSGGDINLVSDGVVNGNGRFINDGNFSVLNLAGEPGDFRHNPISSEGIISSVGDVSFGNYEGVSLKVEAGGSINGGDITITEPNTSLQGTDSDIAILSSESALILRAGLTELQNTPDVLQSFTELRNFPNVPPDQSLGGTTFTATGESSSPGNITVGNIDTSGPGLNGGGPVILFATGNITTGAIKTGGDPFLNNIDSLGGSVNLSADGNIEVETIDTSGSDGGDVTVAAGGVFRATGAFLEEDFVDLNSNTDDIEGQPVLGGKIPTSILATGFSEGGASINIEHGGSSFRIGPIFEEDAEGNVVFRDAEGNLVFFGRDEDGFIEFRDAEGNLVFDVTAQSNLVTLADVPPDASFTAGAITSNQENAGLVASFRDAPLDVEPASVNQARIQINSTFTPTDNDDVTDVVDDTDVTDITDVVDNTDVTDITDVADVTDDTDSNDNIDDSVNGNQDIASQPLVREKRQGNLETSCEDDENSAQYDEEYCRELKANSELRLLRLELTDENFNNATQLEINENGELELKGSGIERESFD